ncbi:MAG TPA: OmpA family protein [Candidatus Kapabacteria bacterium]|nr:OmpA family protein [Candidatus Kapabacteria bacterium]
MFQGCAPMRGIVVLLGAVIVAAPAIVRGQPCADTTRIYPLDEINTSLNELAPTWDANTEEANGTFYFERGPSWYLDTLGHRLYRTGIQSPTTARRELWKLTMPATPVDLQGISPERFEIAPATIPNGGGTQLLYAGISDSSRVRSNSHDKADIAFFQRVNGSFVRQGGGPLELINSSRSWESHPAVSVNPPVIFFSSDRPGGKGGLDLWYVVRIQQTWYGPFNAWELNTPYNEACPYLPPDNARTVYFSSDRPRGNSLRYGFDIYTARRNVPVNEGPYPDSLLSFASPVLMPCINTGYNEMFFAAIDEHRGFYASDSPRQKWNNAVNFDLYQVIPNPDPNPPRPHVEDIATYNPCDAMRRAVATEFDLVDVTNGRNLVVAEGRVNDRTGRATIRFINAFRDNEGEFILRPLAGDAYFSVPVRIYPDRTASLDSIPLWPVSFDERCPIRFKSLVQFESGSSMMRPSDTVRLMELIGQITTYLRSLPSSMQAAIQIDGHTDDVPTRYLGIRNGRVQNGDLNMENNWPLSTDRTRHVRTFLEEHLQGAPGRIRFSDAAHAYSIPLVEYRNKTGDALEQAREQNRRVEIQMTLERR